MPGYEFWKWADPEDLHQQQAQDLVDTAQQTADAHDQDLMHQHVGGLIESFQSDVARRMDPLVSAFQQRWSQPSGEPTPAPAPPTTSPVDDVLANFRSGAQTVASTVGSDVSNAAQAVGSASDRLREAVRPVVDPVMGLIGTKQLYEGYGRQNQILSQARSYTDPSMSDEQRQLEPMRAGPGMIAPALPDAYRQAHPDAANEYDQITSDTILSGVGGIGGGVATGTLNAAGKFVPAAIHGAEAALPTARGLINSGINALTHSPAPDVIASAAERKVAASMGAATPSVDLHLQGNTYKFLDDLAPVKQLMDSREKALGRTLNDNENAYQILRLGRASRETADEWVQTHVGDALQSLPEISGNVNQGTFDLNNYLRAQDAIDKAAAKGNPDRLFGGMTSADAQASLAEAQTRLGPQKFAQLEGAAQKFYDLGDFLLDRKVQAGLVSADTADALKQLYPHHMPIQTIDWLDDKLANTSTRVGKAGGAANDIKELTDFGTMRQSEPPIEAFHRAADRTAALSAKNEAASAIVSASRDVPWAEGLIRPADNASAVAIGQATAAPGEYARLPGETLQQYRINGNLVRFYADRSMDPLFNFGASVGDAPMNKILGGMAKTADATRKLAIAYNPSWGVYQLAMDSLGYLTKNGGFANPAELGRNIKRLGVGADEVGLNPFANRAVGAAEGAVAGGLAPDPDGQTTLADRARNAAIGAGVGAGLKSTGLLQRANSGALYSEARAAGALPGAVDHVTGNAGSYGDTVAKRTGIDVNGPADFARKATKSLLDMIQGVNEKFDAIPRLAEYQTQQAAGASSAQAALAARDITIDPSRGGAYTRALNSVIPFFNVAFQSAAYAPRLLMNPATVKKAASGIASSVILPTLALEAYNQTDPRYADVPTFDKERGFVIMTPGKGEIDPDTGREKPTYLLVRAGPFAPFVTLSRALYNASPAGQGTDWGKEASQVARNWSPIDVSPVIDAVRTGTDPMRATALSAAKYLPSGIKQGTEAAMNYDTFRSRPLVPAGLENQPAENQYSQDTSDVAKYVGSKLGASPAIIDHILRSWGGGADAIVGGVDSLGEGASWLAKNTVGIDTGFGSSGDSQRLVKLQRDLAKSGTTPEDAARIQGEIDRELAIKADHDNALRNVPIVGSLGARYYRESGSQSVDDRNASVDQTLLDKKRDSGPVATELKRLGVAFGDVNNQIGGITLTREMGSVYRAKAVEYRTKVIDDLMKSDLYRNADDKTKGNLVNDAMTQAAGWASHEVAQGNPAIAQRLDEQGAVGSAFIAPQINGNVDVASKRYIGALQAQSNLADIKSNERFRNIAPKDYAQTSADVGVLQKYKALMPDSQAEMVFQSQFGADRLANAKMARESKFWQSRMDAFRRDNPDYGLFIESGPKTFTQRGLDSGTVAKLAGLQR